MSYHIKRTLKISVDNTVKCFLTHHRKKSIFCYARIINKNMYGTKILLYLCNSLSHL